MVRHRLWRCTNPALKKERVEQLESDLGKARSDIRKFRDDHDRLKATRARMNAAKIALGERGPVWWSDGAPDYNRKHPKNTPYRDFWLSLQVFD